MSIIFRFPYLIIYLSIAFIYVSITLSMSMQAVGNHRKVVGDQAPRQGQTNRVCHTPHFNLWICCRYKEYIRYVYPFCRRNFYVYLYIDLSMCLFYMSLTSYEQNYFRRFFLVNYCNKIGLNESHLDFLRFFKISVTPL